MDAKYYPYGDRRNSQGDLGTDKLFTGQRLDGTGLYYYSARYYDPTIGRFISADAFIPWSTGLDIVSHALTVNAVPAGLGNVLAPQGHYPKITSQVPRNPQNLNRYSYVTNNPLTYNDPYGWWTFFIGWYGWAGGIGGGINITIGIARDGHGNWAIVTTPGGGPAVGPSLSTGLQVQGTGAEYVGQLSGLSTQAGGSLTFGASGSAGAEGVVGLGSEKYGGVNFNVGIGVGTPEGHNTFDFGQVEPNGFLNRLGNNVKDFLSGNQQQYYSVASPLSQPQYIGGGFFNWGTDANGTQIISTRDPSTYTVSEWYGDY